MPHNSAPLDRGRVTEAELDTALQVLLTAATPEPRSLNALRASVLTRVDLPPAPATAALPPLPAPAIPTPARSGLRGRPLLLAAVIVLIVAGGIAVPALGTISATSPPAP